jgi:hypothetical protein
MEFVVCFVKQWSAIYRQRKELYVFLLILVKITLSLCLTLTP